MREISRERKGCFIFLLDQSYSMEEPLGNSSRQKCQELATVINAWLHNMVIRATGDKGIKDWLDVGVIGYRTDEQGNPIIQTVLQGPLADPQQNPAFPLVSITQIGAHPLRMEQVTQKIPDEETGDILEMPAEMPVWADPVAAGGTPMCRALYDAYQMLEKWTGEHRGSFPPIVINITDGESQDGDPIQYADSLRDLDTDDGNVLLFNCHLSMTAADSFMFPSSDEILPDDLARVLFQMSSMLPEPMFKQAIAEGFELQPRARGMAFNADMVALLKFIDMGTRAASLR